MENSKKHIGLTDLAYPVFKLGIEEPIKDNGVVLYIYQNTDEDSGITTTKYKVVDDTTIPLPTLATRRLKLLKDGIPLKKISMALFFIADIIKVATPKTWFIDSNGVIFKYTKSVRVPLEFRKIIKIMPIKTGGAVLELEGITSRFKTMYIPRKEEVYAGVLKYGMSYILYGVYDRKYDKTWRMI